MSEARPVLHLLYGKAAAGKSTLARALASDGALVIAQDHWMSRLYKEELTTVADYVRLIARLRAAIGPHIVELLRANLSIILDWPANTVATRAWMKALAERGGAEARLYWLDVSDEVCLARLSQRNASGTHEYVVTPAQFAELSAHCEPPTDAEGIRIISERDLPSSVQYR